MRLIKSIEIRYLRSIHRLSLKKLGDLTIVSGANDVGKSNILKVLNLFFNNDVDWSEMIDFNQDFSLRRLDEVRRESIKGKQFIRIDIDFICPSNYRASLPPTFRVTKIWNRGDYLPQETNNLERQEKLRKIPRSLGTARRMLSQFMNRIRFEYVPAIRDKAYFEYVLENLQETLIATQMKPDDQILKAVKALNLNLRGRSESLHKDFKRATKIEADVSLPEDPYSLFRAFSVSTKYQNLSSDKVDEQESVPLSLRGDGIQARYIASLLMFIADNSSLFYIWGFEEPENSVEYNLAINSSNDFKNIYAKVAQIFITTHSPAFLTLKGENTVSYRVFKLDNTTAIAQLHPSSDESVLNKISEDIGLFRIQEELYNQFIERRDEFLETEKEIQNLQSVLEKSQQPIVYVEGKTDEIILHSAWKKLFPNQNAIYQIKSCDPLSKTNGSAGGCTTLAKFLSTVRSDSPHIAIGIFDQDKSGKDAFSSLPNYFKSISALEGVKISQNGKAIAFLLPVPPGRETYAEYFNLCIEFYFDDDVLSKKTNNDWGLVFEQPEIETRVRTNGAPILKVEKSNLPETRRIVKGKTVFAEKIVPLLKPGEFENFRLIFDKIQSILS